MTWAKLDDQLHGDPRAVEAGLEAMGLYAMALSCMGAYLTDGEITAAQVKRIAGRKGPGLAGRLVAVGLWAELEPGAKWVLISWENCLLSRRQVEDNRARKSDFGRRGGEAKAAKTQESGLAPCHDPGATPVPSRPVPSQEEKREEPPNPLQGGVVGTIPLPGLEDVAAPAERRRRADEDAVFKAYLEARETMGLKGKPPLLDEGRRKLIRARLRDGHSLDDLKAAARGIWRSSWHVSEKRTAFDYALANTKAIERFRDLATTVSFRPSEPKPEENPDDPDTWDPPAGAPHPAYKPKGPRMAPGATPESIQRGLIYLRDRVGVPVPKGLITDG